MNKLGKFKTVKEKCVYVSETYNDFFKEFGKSSKMSAELRNMKWGANGSEALMEELIVSMSDIERYIVTKRNKRFVPEGYSNPFHFDYTTERSVIKNSGQFTISKKNNKRVVFDNLKGRSKVEFNTIFDMINDVNMDRTNSVKIEVCLSPIKVSARGAVIPNSFAMLLRHHDESITCFYFIAGFYHIITEDSI